MYGFLGAYLDTQVPKGHEPERGAIVNALPIVKIGIVVAPRALVKLLAGLAGGMAESTPPLVAVLPRLAIVVARAVQAQHKSLLAGQAVVLHRARTGLARLVARVADIFAAVLASRAAARALARKQN